MIKIELSVRVKAPQLRQPQASPLLD